MVSEGDCVDLFDSWVGAHDKIDNLLCAAEERFTTTLRELDRHVRGLGPFIREKWDIIEGELVESPALDQTSSVRPMPVDLTRVSRDRKATLGTILPRNSFARQKTRRLARGSR